jgi:hypothetical protein
VVRRYYRAYIRYKPEFPILDPNSSEDEDADELEEREKLMWKNGDDVKLLVRIRKPILILSTLCESSTALRCYAEAEAT